VFDPEDTEKLAQRMRGFTDSPGPAERCGERSREIARQHTHEKAVKELGEVVTLVTTCAVKDRHDDGGRQ